VEPTEASKDAEMKPTPQTVPSVPWAFLLPAAPSVPDVTVKTTCPETDMKQNAANIIQNKNLKQHNAANKMQIPYKTKT
jgi:hypothetical protein